MGRINNDAAFFMSYVRGEDRSQVALLPTKKACPPWRRSNVPRDRPATRTWAPVIALASAPSGDCATDTADKVGDARRESLSAALVVFPPALTSALTLDGTLVTPRSSSSHWVVAARVGSLAS
jgi:hypothetical protein